MLGSSRVALLLTLIACKGDSKPAPAPTAPAAKPTEAAPAVADDEAKALAAKPTSPVTIDALGVTIQVPEGTTVTPPRDASSARRNANLKQGSFMVNVFAVHEYSVPDFAKAKEIYKDDKLVSWLRTEETPTGWILFKEVVSSLHQGNRFEVNVRTVVDGTKWDCGVSARTKALGELALAACQTLSSGTPEAPTTPPTTATTTTPLASTSTARPSPKSTAPVVKQQGASVTGSLPREVIARVMRAHAPKLRACYERALATNPTLAVTVTATFVIGSTGQVTSANATGADGTLTSCVAGVVKAATFPAPSGGVVRVSYPYRFAPS